MELLEDAVVLNSKRSSRAIKVVISGWKYTIKTKTIEAKLRLMDCVKDHIWVA